MDALVIATSKVILIFVAVLTRVPERPVREITRRLRGYGLNAYEPVWFSLLGVFAYRSCFQMRCIAVQFLFPTWQTSGSNWTVGLVVRVQESVQSHESTLWMCEEASSQVNLVFCFLFFGVFFFPFLEFLQNLRLFCPSQW